MFWILRKRKVLFAIFLLALVYFLLATLGNKTKIEDDANTRLEVNLAELIDPGLVGRAVANADSPLTCRNSVQGRVLIADDRGNVCDHADLNSADGCCRPSAPSTRLHVCEECNVHVSGCCSVYEHCVSCCMKPESAAVLRRGLDSPAFAAAAPGGNGSTSNSASNVNKVYALVRNHFDLCLTRCRTSSLSVRHENAYADAARKHCFGAAEEANPDDV